MHAKVKNTHAQLSILIVDDSSSDRLLLSSKLQRIGYQILDAKDGNQALDLLSKNFDKIDLILLDVLMPGIDGFETAERIRKFEQDQKIKWHPIIFTSGRTDTDSISHGIECGGDDYLTKPIDTSLLKAKISAMHRISSFRKDLLSANQKLEILAHTDELTQIPNRRHFQYILESEIKRAQRYNTELCIAYMDLDHFKQINDIHGHKLGDIVLQSVTDILSNNLRSLDSIGRIGGEEFCICLPGIDINNSLDPCERYRLLIENLSINTDSKVLNITASFGLTSFIHGEDTASSFMMRADKALYRAKEKGRNCIDVIYPWDEQCMTAT